VEMGVEYNNEIPKEINKEDKDTGEIIQVNRETRRKIKDIFRKIAKLTHPDKTNSDKLINHYINAKKYCEQNNLFELYLICVQLDIVFDLSDFKIEELIITIKNKKNELINLEKSYLWLWVNSNSEEDKDNIVKLFILNNG